MEGNRHYWVFINDQWVCDDKECDAVLTNDQVEHRLNLTQDFFLVFQDNMENFTADTEALYGNHYPG